MEFPLLKKQGVGKQDELDTPELQKAATEGKIATLDMTVVCEWLTLSRSSKVLWVQRSPRPISGSVHWYLGSINITFKTIILCKMMIDPWK